MSRSTISRWSLSLEAARAGLRNAAFFPSIWLYLRRPPTLDEGRATLDRRLERRAADFVDLARGSMYANPHSPYQRLLRHAGCEYGDLERLVRLEGLEGALHQLFRRGVYLTSPELEGKRPVVRGSLSFAVQLEQLRSPHLLRPHPSHARPWPVPLYLAMLADLGVNAALTLAARGGLSWVHALWGKPSAAWAVWMVRHTGCGFRPVRWFSLIDPRGRRLTPRDRLLTRLLPMISRLATAPLPSPEHVPFEAPLPIAEWLLAELRVGRTPHLVTTGSWAVHLCRVAHRAGYDLSGARFSISGEPFTDARRQAFRQVGAAAVPTYGSEESGPIAHGCLEPARPDDYHLYDDLNALIQPGPGGATAELPPDALLVSTLRAGWPFVLLNLSLGDRAVREERACGCPLERLGWRKHLHSVRSFEKLKVAGTVILDTSLMRLLEVELPARFGGGPTDYQLVEDEESVDGVFRLRLLVRPEIGPMDERAAVEMLLAAIKDAGVPVDRLWGRVRWLEVERRAPLLTPGGKTYHVHRADWPTGP